MPNAQDTLAGLVINGRFQAHRITGVQRYAHEIVRRLPADAEVLSPPPGAGKGVRGHLWEQTTLPRAARGRLLWNPSGNGPLAHRPHVLTVHDLFPLDHPEWYSAPYARWYGLMVRGLVARAEHLIAVSEYTRGRLIASLRVAPERITVIPNGLADDWGPATPEQVSHAAARLGLPAGRYVLSLSSLETRKNLRGVLGAWRAIHAELGPDTSLVLAGQAPDPAVYAAHALPADLPRVFYTGYVPDELLRGLYTGARLFVFPSLAEGFGLPLLEALGCGVRAIASSTSSLPEVGGPAACYVDPSDPSALAAAMLRELRTPREPGPCRASLAQAGRFGWAASAQATHAVLAGVLARFPHGAPQAHAAARLAPRGEQAV